MQHVGDIQRAVETFICPHLSTPPALLIMAGSGADPVSQVIFHVQVH